MYEDHLKRTGAVAASILGCPELLIRGQLRKTALLEYSNNNQ